MSAERAQQLGVTPMALYWHFANNNRTFAKFGGYRVPALHLGSFNFTGVTAAEGGE